MVAQGRLGVLDGLRGIAVLLVLWYHVWEISWLPAPLPSLQFIPETGFAGVDLFFYISGFVIVYPFVKALLRGDAPPSWGHFAYRRAIKIVPSYVLSIAVVIAIGYAHFGSAAQALRDIGSHLLFIHTWWQSTYGSINGVLWTLAIEVEFYALFPLLWPAFKRYPWLTAAAMVGFSLLYRAHAQQCCSHTSMDLLVYNLPGYLDIFAAGMISALLYVRWRELNARSIAPLATFAAIGGFVMLALLLQNLWSIRTADEWSTVWQVQNRTLVAAAFTLMGLGSLLAVPAWQRLIANPVLLFFAAISYNLYLYHQPLARLLLKWRIPPYAGTDQHADPHWEVAYTLVAFAVTIAQAALVTYLFERPLLRVPVERWRALVSRKNAARALSQV
ncbi:MAG TPA: acyltransferase [Candidatus Baltobacteraceae bacterium]|nr:acyltransferase [Candidatus Baltobacteraceae bacterium]